MKFNSIAQSSIAVLTLMFVPIHSFATTAPPAPAPYCVAVNGGFGNSGYSGSTFVARSFSFPEASKCSPWAGYTKTSATVIFTTSGTACLSSDSTALTVSVSSTDPSYLPISQLTADYIQLSRGNATEPFTGQDFGAFAGSAEPVSCTTKLLTLPSSHD